MLLQSRRIEVGFELDDFRKPINYVGAEAWTHLVIQLAMIEPGTIASNPSIGIGMKGYDFLLEEDRNKLQKEINRQVPLFYPDMPFNGCTVTLPGDTEDNDLLYLALTFTMDSSLETVVVVAQKRGYNYIDFAIAM